MTEGKATIDDVLSSPEKFDGMARCWMACSGLGPACGPGQGSGGAGGGVSFLAARDDGRTICGVTERSSNTT